jgi:predicted  nucleic acid-binding Zn ribbon protein
MAAVTIPAADSLDESHHTSYIRRDIARFREIEVNGPYFGLIGEGVADEVCVCLSSSSYLLYTDYVTLASPLRCGDCGEPVPLYRIPPTYEDEYYNVISWQSDYQSCDSLRMNCRTLERAATRQLSDPASSLSHQGRALCQQAGISVTGGRWPVGGGRWPVAGGRWPGAEAPGSNHEAP